MPIACHLGGRAAPVPVNTIPSVGVAELRRIFAAPPCQLPSDSHQLPLAQQGRAYCVPGGSSQGKARGEAREGSKLFSWDLCRAGGAKREANAAGGSRGV